MAEENENAFRVGSVLSQSVSTYFRNFTAFGTLSIIGLALLTAMQRLVEVIGTLVVDTSTSPPSLTSSLLWFIPLNAVAYLLIVNVLTATLVYGTVQHVRGVRVSIFTCLAQGLAVVLPVIGVAIVATIAISVGLIMLVIPGIVAILMLWVAVPVAVVERPGVFASLRRSDELTAGHRWSILGLIILLIVLSSVVQGIVSQIPNFGIVFGVSIVAFLGEAFITGFDAVVIAVCYNHLRMAKEGIDIEEIAAVFD